MSNESTPFVVKLPLAFATYLPHAIPRKTNSIQKALGSKESLKILLYLNSKIALRRGTSPEAILQACKIPYPRVLTCIERLEREGLMTRRTGSLVATASRYVLSRDGHRFLALVLARLAMHEQRQRQVQLILSRCRLRLHLTNRPRMPRRLIASR